MSVFGEEVVWASSQYDDHDQNNVKIIIIDSEDIIHIFLCIQNMYFPEDFKHEIYLFEIFQIFCFCFVLSFHLFCGFGSQF